MSAYKYLVCLFIFFAATVGAADDSLGLFAEPAGVLQGKLDQPSDVAISDDGRAYVLDGVNGRVEVFTADGEEDFIFSPVDLFAEKNKGKLNLPMGIAIADGRVYIADSGNHRIVLFDLRGRFLKSLALSAPSPDQLPPEPVALTVNDGVITWSDRRNHRICRTNANNGEELRCWGKRGEGKNEFQFPYQLGMDRDDYIHVVDVLNGRVQMFNHQGRRFSPVGRFGLEPGEFYRPNGLAFSARGELLVSDAYRGMVSRYRDGRFMGLLSDQQGKVIHFEAPVGLTVWRDRLYVVDALKNRVEIFRLHNTDAEQTEPVRTGQKSMSQKNCVTCHLAWAENYTSGEGEQDGVPPVATPRMCYSCHHGAIIDSRRAIGHREQHPDIHHSREEKKQPPPKEKREDKIPKAFPLLGTLPVTNSTAGKQLSCGSCHTPHNADTKDSDTLYTAHANPWLRVLNKDGDLCQQCHESKLDSTLDKKHPRRGVNHPVGIYLKSPPTPDAKGYASAKKLHDGLPKALLEEGANIGGQDQMTCQSCHRIHGAKTESLLPLKDDKGQLCTACHERHSSKDEKDARRKGVHPVNVKLEEPLKLGDTKIKFVTCKTCHPVHDGRKDSPLLTRQADSMEKLCASCHERHHAKDEKDAKRKGVHPVNMDLEKAIKLGEGKEQEEVKRITCLTCHSVHKGKPDTPSLRFEHRDGKLCSYCHEDLEAVVNSDHDLRITAKDSKNHFKETPAQSGACGACHTLHQGRGKSPFLFAQKVETYKGKEPALERDKLCLNCHRKKDNAEKVIVEHFSHPAKDLVLRSDPKVMPLVDKQGKISEFGAIACVTCHNPHRWAPQDKTAPSPSSAPAQPAIQSAIAPKDQPPAKNRDGNVLNSFLRRKGAKGTFCISCHGLETRVKYKYYHDKFTRDIGVDYIE
jgi:predicted CXXCH cytochrome family protein